MSESVAEKKQPKRERMKTVGVQLPASTFDRVAKAAEREGISAAAILRRLVFIEFRKQDRQEKLAS